MERLDCIKMDFAEFQNIMDDICDMDESWGYYWDFNSNGVFFRKTSNSPNFTMLDLAKYFDVNRIREIVYVMVGTNGVVYIIAE